MITGVTIKGYKCLKDVTVDGLTPFTVCIGPNDSGKSSFLEAIAQFSSATPSLSWEYCAVRTSEVEWVSADRQMAMGFPQLPHFRHGPKTLPVDELLRSEPAFKAIHASARVRLDADMIARAAPRGLGELSALLSGRGHGVAAHLARLALSDRARLETIVGAFTRVTQGRVTDILTPDRPNELQFDLNFRLWDGRTVAGGDLSQGLLLYLGFLCVVNRDDAPSVLLIEEPENGLHPHRLKELIELLRTFLGQDKQVILTTHSPDLLSFCRPEEVIVFQRPNRDSGTEIHRIEHFEKRSVLDASLGEVWASGGEDALLRGPVPAEASVVAEPR